MGVPYTFATATTSIPLSELDANFNTQVTIGTSTVGLGNTTTSLVGLSNVSTTALTVTNDASISGLTVGKGGGNVASNTAVGSGALSTNSSGIELTAFGYNALNLSTGSYNSAFGRTALSSNTTGANNTGIGHNALQSNTTGNYNTALGDGSLVNNTTASNNAAVGYQAGYSNSSGTYNTFIGKFAGYYMTGSKNTVIGRYDGTQGGLNIATSSNYIVLSDGDGNPKYVADNSGNTLFGCVNLPDTTHTGVAVSNPDLRYSRTSTSIGSTAYHWGFFNPNGLVGHIETNGSGTNYVTSSDQRLKTNIVDSPSAISSINSIQVRSFDWIADKTHQEYGVVAQEIQTIAPECVSQGTAEEEMWGVDYSKLVPRMIKAIQELNTLVTTQAAEIAALKAKVGA